MIKIRKKHYCCGCQACLQACPKGCIAMKADEEGFLYPVVDVTSCVQCGLCEKVCPVLHSTDNTQQTPKAYAAYNLNEEVRLVSSSGGIFTLLAEHVLEQSGIIYGAAMVDFRIKHIRVPDVEGLALLRGSKYVQSDIGKTYIQAKTDLEKGRMVLFTGTPCQIEGLRSFLRKDYENLITMDIICHGVPSPMVWEKYVALREKTAGAPASRIFFRHKKYGWKTFEVLFEFSNKTSYDCRFFDDSFMQAFLQDLCLRPSCYACKFKKIHRVSDITVADFWGIESICPEMNDDKGTSLVVIHSARGSTIFDTLRNGLCYKEVDLHQALRSNTAMYRSAKKPKLRDAFMNDIMQEPFDVAVHKFVRKRRNPGIKSWVKAALHRLGLLSMAKKMLRR